MKKTRYALACPQKGLFIGRYSFMGGESILFSLSHPGLTSRSPVFATESEAEEFSSTISPDASLCVIPVTCLSEDYVTGIELVLQGLGDLAGDMALVPADTDIVN